MNCLHKTNDVVASSNSDVTRKAVCAPAVLSVEGINRLVARKRFLPTKHSALSLIYNSRKRWMACKGLVSLIIIRLIMILSMLGGLTKIRRCERKSIVGNSMECGSNEKLRNVGAPYPFNIFRKCLNTVLGFQRKLWHCGMIYLLWERNKLGTRKRKKLRSFVSRPILRLRNLRLGNIFQETFGLRFGNVMETFMVGQRFENCSCLFADLCASCHGQLRLFKLNLKFRYRFKVIYVYIYIYIYIYVFCCNLLSYKLASYPGVFTIKMYTLVYFSPKVTLLMRKSCYKNQSINLIGLAHVGKAYSRNRLFLEHIRPYWRELRPLVTPWVKSIKEGTDPWKNQKRALLSQCPGELPSPLSLSPLLLLLSYVLVFFAVAICL